MSAIRALVFDVFGTLVDWRSGIAREAERVLGPGIEGGAFADAWRACYQPSMEPIRVGLRQWVDLDTLHAESLKAVLAERGLALPDADAERALVAAWHRLDGWPEVREAMTALHRRYRLAPLSNAHVSLAVDLARHNGWTFDAILGGGFSRDYKPKPALYRDAIAALGFAPPEILMVAAHSSDLAAAAGEGLSTAHIARPREHGPAGGETGPGVPVTYAATDLADLARQLGC